MYVISYYLVCFFICISHIAFDFIFKLFMIIKRKWRYIIVTALNFKLEKIYGTLVYTGRSACFETSYCHSCLFKTLCKAKCRQSCVRTA